MPLDHPFTCPKIDTAISSAKVEIYAAIEGIVGTLDPEFEAIMEDRTGYPPGEIPDLLDPVAVGKFYIKEMTAVLHDEIADMFEDMRTVNEELRDAAEKQIDNMHDRIEELEAELETAQDRIHILEQENSELEYKIYELENKE